VDRTNQFAADDLKVVQNKPFENVYMTYEGHKIQVLWSTERPHLMLSWCGNRVIQLLLHVTHSPETTSTLAEHKQPVALIIQS
jgi:hypothetical protein